jgi:hypothetical protein
MTGLYIGGNLAMVIIGYISLTVMNGILVVALIGIKYGTICMMFALIIMCHSIKHPLAQYIL